MNAEKMIKDYLVKNGFDGLYDDEPNSGCCCELNNLIPCYDSVAYPLDCKPGYKVEDNQGSISDYLIVEDKPKKGEKP